MMSLSSTVVVKKYLIYSAIVLMSTAVIVYVTLRYCYPLHYFSSFPWIPVLFYVYGVGFIGIFEKVRQAGKKDLLIVYLGNVVARFIFFLCIWVGIMLSESMHRIDFVLTSCVFYFFIVIFETLFFVSYERQKRRVNNQKIKENE